MFQRRFGKIQQNDSRYVPGVTPYSVVSACATIVGCVCNVCWVTEQDGRHN
jgi:hypothetical protein